MILRRLRMCRFLGFVDQAFDFAPGINVIVGPNEAGKSTLRAAIRTVLYANPATTSAKQDAYRTWGLGQPPVLELEFEVDGRPYMLTKDFHNRKILLVGAGGTWDQHKKVQEGIANLLGLATDGVFQNTAEVAQAELERVQLTSVSKELSRVLGGGEDVAAAIRRLEQHVREMEKGLKGLTREPGILRTLEDRAASLRAQQERLAGEAAELERKQGELAELKAPLPELEAELAARKALLELNRETLRLEQQLESLRREEAMLSDRVGRIDQTLQTIGDINRRLEEATSLGMPDEAAIKAARILEDRVAHLDSEVDKVRIEWPPGPPPARPTRWMAAVAAGLAMGAAAWLVVAMSWVIGVLLGFVGAAMTLAGGLRWWQHVATTRTVRAQNREHESRVWALEQELSRARQEFLERCAAFVGESLDAAEKRLEQYLGLLKERAETLKILDVLRSGSTDDTLRDRLSVVRSEIYGLSKELQAPDRAARRLVPLEVQRLETDVDRLASQVTDLSERVKRLTWEVEHRRSDAEDLAAVEEQLQEAEEALASARRRHGVYGAALDGLKEARGQIERPVREVVASRASDYLRILSGGRYDHIEVEKDSLQVWVWSRDAGTMVEPKEPAMSRGTIDLVYLSLRLALVPALAEGRRPPLLLDDPFITFDETRRAAAAQLLRELSKTHQVFLFTCSPRFDANADNVILLPARGVDQSVATVPTGVNVAVEAPVPATQAEAPVPSMGPLWDHTRQP